MCSQVVIKSLEFGNISEEHSATNTLRYDTSNNLHKHLLYKQFVAWHTNGCSAALLTDFSSQPIAQELKDEAEYYDEDSDEKVYVDLRDSRGYTNELDKPSRNDSKMTINIKLKNALTKKKCVFQFGDIPTENTIKSQYEELEA